MRLITKSVLTVALGLAPVTAFAADGSITAVTATPSSTLPGATTSLDITFTTTGVTSDHSITFAIINEAGDATETSLDFSAATTDFAPLLPYAATNKAVVSDYAPAPGFVVDGAYSELDSDIPAGTYTLTIEGIVNSSEPVNYNVGVTSSANQMDMTAYTLSDTISVTEPVFDTTAPVELKVKDITKTSAKLKWGAVTQDGFDVIYTVVLFKKNGDKVKTFKNLTTLNKAISKTSGLLKAGKSYKFRVKACDAVDAETCGDWSSYKSFTMKAAE